MTELLRFVHWNGITQHRVTELQKNGKGFLCDSVVKKFAAANISWVRRAYAGGP
jgi:hypothetical protein